LVKSSPGQLKNFLIFPTIEAYEGGQAKDGPSRGRPQTASSNENWQETNKRLEKNRIKITTAVTLQILARQLLDNHKFTDIMWAK